MRHRAPAALLLAVALATAAGPRARATTFLPADLRTLVSAASTIAHGRVVAVDVQLTERTRAVERRVVVAVADYYKGDLGGEVLLTVPGGTIGAYRTVMVGAPEFRHGEEVVLFLQGDAPDAVRLVGLAQGVVRVRVDTRSGLRTVWPPASAAMTDAAGRVLRGQGARRALPLEAFAAEVRRLAERRDRPGRPR
jgi:hypothetical protein